MSAGLDGFLDRSGIAKTGAARTWTPLTGGVSSDIWRVDIEDGQSICVKRALPKLKVAADWEAPVSRNAYEWHWMKFAAGVQPGVVPNPLAHDAEAGVFAMEFLPPARFPLWKAQLLAGQVDVAFAGSVGSRLGQLHAASAHRADLASLFDTTASFHALRLEPYLHATARRYPELSDRLISLAEVTARTRLALVHGDISPKNILAGPDGPVILDAECAWFGDPAFDLAFCLNHLLLKAVMRPETKDALALSFEAFVAHYFEHAAPIEQRERLEGRAAALLPALLLARVDGKSPVEYLVRDWQLNRVRRASIPLLHEPVVSLHAVADFCYDRLTSDQN